MKQNIKKNYYSQSNRKTEVCLLMSNALTGRASKHLNIPALSKLLTLKQNRKQNKITLKKNLGQNSQNPRYGHENSALIRIKQAIFHPASPSINRKQSSLAIYQNNANDKFIDKPQPNSHRKNYYSCLQKCRIATESYDTLKNEIISQIKINKKHIRQKSDRQKIILFEGVCKKDKQNQSFVLEDEKHQKNPQIKTNRHRSYSDSHKKPQRYQQLSVAQFMEQQQANISSAITKKFDQIRKTYQKHSDFENQNQFIDYCTVQNGTKIILLPKLTDLS